MKKQPNDLNAWLETNFPGQMQISHNIINLDLKNLYYKKTSTIVADKNDPEAQIMITWFKEQEGLGINKDEIQTSLDNSRRDVATARSLFKSFHEKGLERISVGVIDYAAYILIYDEPNPTVRKKQLQQILETLNTKDEASLTSIWIEYMEADVYQKEFKDIVPFGYWQRGGSYHEDNKIMSLEFEQSQDMSSNELDSQWKINSSSLRSSEYVKSSYNAAQLWAEKNLTAPYYIEPDQMIEYDVDEDDPLAIHYHFPYYAAKPDTSAAGYEDTKLGYVSGTYQTDQKTFTKIKRVKEL